MKKQYQRSVVVLGILFCVVGIAAPSFGSDSSAPLGSCTTSSGELNCVALDDLPAAPEVERNELDAFDLPAPLVPVQEKKPAQSAHKGKAVPKAAKKVSPAQKIAAKPAKNQTPAPLKTAASKTELPAKEAAAAPVPAKERSSAPKIKAKEQETADRPSNPPAPPPPPAPSWTLKAGETVGHGLQMWGDRAGWKVVWNLTKDWSVPAPSTFHGDFRSVATEVLQALASNGALIRGQFYEGNNTLVVTGPGDSAQ